jgi:hypothetical protein
MPATPRKPATLAISIRFFTFKNEIGSTCRNKNQDMEDYARAYEARRLDIDVLLASNPPRSTAAAHFGGITVECRLKALVIKYHNLNAWDQPSGRLKDPRYKQSISCPGHGLMTAIRLMSDVYRKAKADPHFLSHLSRIMHPTSATTVDFIELRYSADDLDGVTMADWHQSLEYVLGWLKKNEAIL